MTKAQITLLLTAAHIVPVAVRGTGADLEVELANRTDYDRFYKLVAKWGGYTTGYGSVVVQANTAQTGDWSDRTSRHHY